MTQTAAQLAASRAYKTKLDQIMVRPHKDEGAQIRAAADAAGQSVQAYVLQAVRERMSKTSDTISVRVPRKAVEDAAGERDAKTWLIAAIQDAINNAHG